MAGSDKPSLVALSQRRESVIELLTQRYAEGVLEIEDFESRVGRAHEAGSVAALETLVSDLEPAARPASSVALQRQTSQALDTPRPRAKKMIAIMGGVERKGHWNVPQVMNVYAMMGGVDLDFRDAVLQPGVTEIRTRVLMGGVDIIVPPGVAVEADGVAIMGGFDDHHRPGPWSEADGPRPVLRITGMALMGGVDIETRLPGESKWQARKRLRQERKALRKREQLRYERRKQLAAARKQLPSEAEDDE